MGVKVQYRTKQREEIISYLKTVPGKHVTAADVRSHFQDQAVSVGQTTIYRQLEKLVEFLSKQTDSERRDLDVQRKRLLAAVCAFCEDTVGKWEEMDDKARIWYAKGVACRAAGKEACDNKGRDNFNRLSLERLKILTYAFFFCYNFCSFLRSPEIGRRCLGISVFIKLSAPSSRKSCHIGTV